MRAIAAVSTIASISILMVGCTGCLRTCPFCLRTCVCTHVLSHVCVLCRLSDILRRFFLGCKYFLAVSLALWQSYLPCYLSSKPTPSQISRIIHLHG